jgi:hypothetical protein
MMILMSHRTISVGVVPDVRPPAQVKFTVEGADGPQPEIYANDVLRERAIAARPAPVHPAELNGLILAQRGVCRAAGRAWEDAAAEATLRELAAAVAQRQAAMANDAAVTAQQAHGAALNRLWELEAQRDG